MQRTQPNENQQKQTESECFCLEFISGRENILCTHVTSSYSFLICPRRKTKNWWSLRRHGIKFNMHFAHTNMKTPQTKCKLPTTNCKICIQIIVEFQSTTLNRTNTFDSIQLIRKFHCINRIWKMFGIRRSNVVHMHNMYIEFSIKIFTFDYISMSNKRWACLITSS